MKVFFQVEIAELSKLKPKLKGPKATVGADLSVRKDQQPTALTNKLFPSTWLNDGVEWQALSKPKAVEEEAGAGQPAEEGADEGGDDL